MRILVGRVAVGAAVVVGLTVLRMGPASPGSDRTRADAIADVVALLHHDQQGIVLAHQAAAQSPTVATRNRAVSLAADFRVQGRALVAMLDARRVPTRRRLVDTTRIAVGDAGSVGCDIMPKDAVSRLAASAPVDFDAKFSTLMDRHLAGGERMAAFVLGRDAFDARERRVVSRTQAALT